MTATVAAEAPLRLLVVEDSEHDAVLAVAEMRRAGVEVEWRRVETERDLRAALAEFTPDVVLSDYSIPGFGGMAALAVCCAEAPEIPFLVCTGSTSEEKAVECMKAGAWDYVLKDRPARLPRAVVAALDLARTRRERRRFEAALSETQELYRRFVTTTSVGVWSTDADHRTTFANAAMAEMLGVSADAMLGVPVERFMFEEDLADHQAQMKARHAGRDGRYLRRFRRSDGGERWFLVSGTAQLDMGGGFAGSFGTFTDVTEQREAQESLRRSEELLLQSGERYRTLFEQSPVSIWEEDFSRVRERFDELRAAGVTDWAAHLDAHPEDLRDLASRVRILDVNETSLRVFGVERKGDLQSTLERYFDEESYPAFRDEMAALAEGATRVDLELPIRDAHGARRIVSLSLSVVPGCEETLERVLVSFDDVTKERSLQAQLAQAQKMEAVGRLAGGVAHDFNNLLAVIHGHGELAHGLAADQPALQGRLAQMLSAAERAAALTRQLLAFSRRQPLRLVRVDLNDIVADTTRMLQRLIGEDVEVVTELVEDPVPVQVDAAQIGQVLVNLALNARDAMPAGGRLTISTARVVADEVFAAARPGMAPGAYAALSVRDTGTGIEPEAMGHLFEPFFTTKPEGRGTGLGLSTAYGVVRQSGGHISVRSAPGQGSEFTVHLPLAEAAAERTEARAASAGGGTGTVLVAEDQEALRELVVEMLSDAGYTVLEAKNAGEALLLVEQTTDHIELMVADVVMPIMRGTALAARLRELKPELRILLMSGYAEDLEDELGRTAFLQKPFTADVLSDRVRSILDEPTLRGGAEP